MSVVLFKDGYGELFDPFLFNEQLNHGWFLTREESLKNGMFKKEVKENPPEEVGNEEDEESEESNEEEVLTTESIPKVKFKCNGCGKRKTWNEQKIIKNDFGDLFCSEECKTIEA